MFLDITIRSGYLATRWRSLTDELKKFVKKPLHEQMTNVRWYSKRQALQFVLDSTEMTASQSSISQTIADVSSSQLSTSSTFVPMPSSEPSTSRACVVEDFEMEIPSFLNNFAVEEIDEEEDNIETVPGWVKRLCNPEEIARQKEIAAKIRAAQAKKSEEAAKAIAQNGDSHNFGRKRRAVPEMPSVDLNNLIPNLINKVNEITGTNQQDESDESAGQYAALIVNSLMKIDESKRQQAYNDIVRYGNNYGQNKKN